MAKPLALQEVTQPTDNETLAEARAWLTHVDEQIRFLFELSLDIARRRGEEIERMRGRPCQ